jgi:hypothetical protein
VLVVCWFGSLSFFRMRSHLCASVSHIDGPLYLCAACVDMTVFVNWYGCPKKSMNRIKLKYLVVCEKKLMLFYVSTNLTISTGLTDYTIYSRLAQRLLRSVV